MPDTGRVILFLRPEMARESLHSSIYMTFFKRKIDKGVLICILYVPKISGVARICK